MWIVKRWRHLARVPSVISFPEMSLLTRDFEPELVAGTGSIDWASPRRFTYRLEGKPTDEAFTLQALTRQRAEPYDGLLRFRLRGQAEDGASYSLGWTVPEKVVPGLSGDSWVFEGHASDIWVDDSNVSASEFGAAEAEFWILKDSYVADVLTTIFGSSSANDAEPVIRLFGSEISMHFEPEPCRLIIHASGSPDMQPHYVENWLGEPLRLMFGQLIYPRIVARIFPAGRAAVSVRPIPEWFEHSGWLGLWRGNEFSPREHFLKLYRDILYFIASARDTDGHPNWESNRVIKLFEEVIQASDGSRTNLALTAATSVEGLTKIVAPLGAWREDAPNDQIDDLIEHINRWSGHEPIKASAVRAVKRHAELTVDRIHAQLVARDVIRKSDAKAWKSVRHNVAHGELISPYSSKEEDRKLLALGSLMRGLTSQIIKQFASETSLSRLPPQTPTTSTSSPE